MRLILILCTLLAAIACTSVRPASAEKVAATPKLLARGAYLADHVLNCMHCHSEGDPNVWGMPPRAGTAGTGGNCWDPSGGFPGHVCASNLTPDPDTGLGRWTDGEILRINP